MKHIHHILWVLSGIAVLILGIYIPASRDYAIKQAVDQAQINVLVALPLSTITEMKVSDL